MLPNANRAVEDGGHPKRLWAVESQSLIFYRQQSFKADNVTEETRFNTRKSGIGIKE